MKENIKNFFNKHAHTWDKYQTIDQDKINKILDFANIGNNHVLDIACGTGVLFDFYQQRNVRFTAIDISEQMITIAKQKYPNEDIILGDVETYQFNTQFDSVMIYNAFPHFLNPKETIEITSSLVKPGGYFTIAHSMSKKTLDEHHKHVNAVSIELLDIDTLEQLLSRYYSIQTKISDDHMYIIVGKKML